MTVGTRRPIAWWWVFPIVVALFLGSIVLSLFLPHPTAADQTADGGFYSTVHGVVWGGIAPKLVLLLLVCLAITLVRLWPRVIKDSVPTRRWVVAVPVLMAAPSLIFADYQALASRGPTFLALVVVMVLVIAAAEELMFRGLALEMLRDGLAEPWAAVISTLMFGAVHFINGVGSLPTVISAFIGGYLYYLTRRSTVYIIFPILTHAAFDLFGYSHWAGGDASFYMFVYQVVLFVVVVSLSKIVGPRNSDERSASSASDSGT